MPKAFKQPNREATRASSRNAKGAWQIQTAKARFSEVFRLARTEGPQRITRQGKEGVAMILDAEFDQLLPTTLPSKSNKAIIRPSPLLLGEIALERDQADGRDH